MSERDDYLLDPRAPVDPAIAALERALAPLRWREGPLREGAPDRPPQRRRGGVRAGVALAALLLAAWSLWWWMRDGELRPGAAPRTFVAAGEARTVQLGALVEITLKPGSELEFVHWRDHEQALLKLTRGGLTAHAVTPPQFFLLDTPLGRVVDHGCRYEIDLRADGQFVHVREGMVSFRFGDREVYVPAGASTVVDENGPRTPCFDDATAELAKVVRDYDQTMLKQPGLELRLELAKRILATVQRERDSLVLWHLLGDAEPAVREMAEGRLLELVGTPEPSKASTFPALTWLPFLRLTHWQAR